MYAITPNGVGNPVGARRIKPDWPLADEETFVTDHYEPGMVLADDGQSLRWPNDTEVVEGAKKVKITELRDACREHIFAGFDSDALGPVHRYPLSQTDQANNQKTEVSAMKNADTVGWTGVMQCIDGNGVKKYRAHTAAQVDQVTAEIDDQKERALKRLENLIAQVNDKATDTQAKLDAIQW